MADNRFEVADTKFEVADNRFEGADTKFEVADNRFEGADTEFEVIKTKNNRKNSTNNFSGKYPKECN